MVSGRKTASCPAEWHGNPSIIQFSAQQADKKKKTKKKKILECWGFSSITCAPRMLSQSVWTAIWAKEQTHSGLYCSCRTMWAWAAAFVMWECAKLTFWETFFSGLFWLDSLEAQLLKNLYGDEVLCQPNSHSIPAWFLGDRHKLLLIF